MFVRIFSASLVVVTAVGIASAQNATINPQTANRWQPTGSPTVNTGGSLNRSATSTPLGEFSRTARLPARSSVDTATKGFETLPNDHGQVSRKYDISRFTQRLSPTDRPEQSIVDWILRETGYEAWHAEPFGYLSANRRSLSVYHTPEMQAVVADIVDRFVSSAAETKSVGLRIVTIANPDWRSKAMRLMKSVPVQTQGLQGWIMPKEDAGLLLAELRNRTDYREHSSSQLLVGNGESTAVSSIRTRAYVSGVIPSAAAWPGYEVETSTIEEGYSLDFNPLISLDGRTVDAVIKLRVNQIEKMCPVMIDVPSPVSANQRTKIEVPQMTTCVMHERFRWPANHVLLLSVGVVAAPAPPRSNPIANVLALATSPARADLLLFVECKGDTASLPARTTPALRTAGGAVRRY